MNLGSLETAAVHGGRLPDEPFNALSVPIYPSSVFGFPDLDQGAAIHEGEQPGYFYGRMGNPTQAALEDALCTLERGEAALAVASGMMAISTALLTTLRSGGHLVAPRSLYATTYALFEGLLKPFGVEVSYVDATDVDQYRQAIRDETQALYLESPANPTLALTDLAAVGDVAREHGVLTIMDNTFATPINQRPLERGIDVVVHSATKYLGGHGDLVAGALVGPPAFIERARWRIHKLLGGVVAPQTAWLILRGLKTLALRLERHNANALAVAQFLDDHPKVETVHYPGLASHPQHELARAQMEGFGGMVSFDVGSVDRGRALLDRLELCTLAVSLGDVATLIQHSASMTHASVPPDQRRQAGITDGLIRLSVGIESVDDIIADLDQGLAAT